MRQRTEAPSNTSESQSVNPTELGELPSARRPGWRDRSWLAGGGGHPGGPPEAAGGGVPQDRNQYSVCHVYQAPWAELENNRASKMAKNHTRRGTLGKGRTVKELLTPVPSRRLTRKAGRHPSDEQCRAPTLTAWLSFETSGKSLTLNLKPPPVHNEGQKHDPPPGTPTQTRQRRTALAQQPLRPRRPLSLRASRVLSGQVP